MNKRSNTLDQMKGAAILLVVVGHAVQFNTIQGINSKLFDFIYSFHMPLFMFLSGYIAYLSFNILDISSFFNLLIKKTKRLILPFLSWYFIVNFMIFRKSQENLLAYSLRLIDNPDVGLWFLWVLACLSFLLAILVFIEKKCSIERLKEEYLLIVYFLIYLVSVLCVIKTKIDILGFKLIVWHMPFFFSGYWIARCKSQIIYFKHLIIQTSILAFPIMLVFYSWSNNNAFVIMNIYRGPFLEYINMAYRYAIAFFGISISFSVIECLKNERFKSILSLLGTFTLEIYILHYFFIDINGSNLIDQGNVMEFILTIIFACFFSISMSMLLSSVLKKSRVLSFLLFGV